MTPVTQDRKLERVGGGSQLLLYSVLIVYSCEQPVMR